MIAADSSSPSALFRGDDGPDVELLDQALGQGMIVLPPVVLTEILSDPVLDTAVADLIRDLSLLETHPGFWERAARLRAGILTRGRRARLANTLISQSCLDHEAPLITRDRGFRCGVRRSGSGCSRATPAAARRCTKRLAAYLSRWCQSRYWRRVKTPE